jgi:hypothetical protein
VTVMNGTGKVGLAHTVAGELKGRGFTVAKVGNTPAPVTGASEVFYGPGQQPAAVSVAEQLPEVSLRLRPAAGVELDIGSLFTGLASPAQVIAEHTRDLAAASVVHRCPASP